MKLLLLISNFSSLNQSDSSEPVYFVKVEAKEICEEIMADNFGYTLNSGEKYFRGKYLQNVRSRKLNKKQFQLINRDIVTLDEAFEVFFGFDNQLAIDINAYLHLTEQSSI